MKKLSRILLLIFAPLMLTGCLGELISLSCDFMDDSDHCYQSAAVQKADPDECEEIKGEDFGSASNPPKDKCYLMIAENTGRTDVCDKIEGGFGSYTKEQCLEAADAKNKESGGEANDPAEFRKAREELMGGLDDDVKSEIAKVFTEFRDKNPGLSVKDQIKKMEEIKNQQEWLKGLDDQANTLMDQIKDSANDFASQTVDDLYGEDIEAFQKAAKEKTLAYLEKNGGADLRKGIEELEKVKEGYDKLSEQYEAINEKVEKLKKAYDEIHEVYAKVDAVNQLVAEGKLEPDKAKVLHGAIYLGKGLEYATSYVPVFGSTVSAISKETFEATVKFATSRAQRTTAINKCIEDPENCDPSGITPY